jgi:CubicO group peptidase (beta-lactamase class C family)
MTVCGERRRAALTRTLRKAARWLALGWLAPSVLAFAAHVGVPPAAAQQEAHGAASPAGAVPGHPAAGQPLERRDLEAWLDGYMPFALARGDLAGAVVVVVKDGQVLLKKGYGVADVATHRPVDPDTTLVRPGSVSKLFTWTAVMQQVEAGRLDLDRDVNDYIDFRIPPFSGQPVTMRNLMTHTAGFEESFDDLLVRDPAAVPSLEAFLKHRVPARIFPPGRIPAYSNYGTALAGYIVQRMAGVPFERYVDARIFAPLGMDHSSFRQPLPEALRRQLSSGYKLASGAAQPYEIFATPAGNAALTGADMARFMIAHLQDGEYDGQRILAAATARTMHDTALVTTSPFLNPMALGFFRCDRHGQRILGHEGDTYLFHSALELYPDEHVGIFLSVNSIGRDGGARALRAGLLEGFTERYFGRAATQAVAGGFDPKADLASIAGTYESSQRSEHSFLSLLGLVLQTTVGDDGAGHLVASSVVGLDGVPRRFEEVAPFVWRELGGGERLAAQVVDGKVAAWSDDAQSPAAVFLRAPARRNASWLLPLFLASLAVLLLTAIAWPVDAWVARRRPRVASAPDDVALGFRRVRIAALAALALTLAWLALLFYMFSTFELGARIEPWALALHVCSIGVFPLALVAALGSAWRVFARRAAGIGVLLRVWSVLLVAASGGILWVAVVFHLIGLDPTF